MDSLQLILEKYIYEGLITQEEFDKMVETERQKSPIPKMKEATDKLKTVQEVYSEMIVEENVSLEDLKQAKINVLKYDCSEAIYEGFEQNGNLFGFREHDQMNFTQQLLLVVAGYTGLIEWKTKNNGVQKFTVSQFSAIINKAGTHKKEQQYKYWLKEQDILSAVAKEDIDSIDW